MWKRISSKFTREPGGADAAARSSGEDADGQAGQASQDDAAAAAALPEEAGAEDSHQMLVDMGFDATLVERALRESNGVPSEAALWLLSLPADGSLPSEDAQPPPAAQLSGRDVDEALAQLELDTEPEQEAAIQEALRISQMEEEERLQFDDKHAQEIEEELERALKLSEDTFKQEEERRRVRMADRHSPEEMGPERKAEFGPEVPPAAGPSKVSPLAAGPPKNWPLGDLDMRPVSRRPGPGYAGHQPLGQDLLSALVAESAPHPAASSSSKPPGGSRPESQASRAGSTGTTKRDKEGASGERPDSVGSIGLEDLNTFNLQGVRSSNSRGNIGSRSGSRAGMRPQALQMVPGSPSKPPARGLAASSSAPELGSPAFPGGPRSPAGAHGWRPNNGLQSPAGAAMNGSPSSLRSPVMEKWLQPAGPLKGMGHEQSAGGTPERFVRPSAEDAAAMSAHPRKHVLSGGLIPINSSSVGLTPNGALIASGQRPMIPERGDPLAWPKCDALSAMARPGSNAASRRRNFGGGMSGSSSSSTLQNAACASLTQPSWA
eukprot:TRINITY_DN8890_c0_g1_i1.p1 TRINITY_DN8890_c0_g1~~TRINITY_DN8890_c0_g1_i1.p1  ORF type:complete len:549 (-),score=109.46 TRINITY_DN8890_c0_g1_i1:125-1771(-)